MNQTKEIINEALENTTKAMLKAEIYLDVIEDIFNSIEMKDHIRQKLDYSINFELRDTICELSGNIKSYKNKLEKEL